MVKVTRFLAPLSLLTLLAAPNVGSAAVIVTGGPHAGFTGAPFSDAVDPLTTQIIYDSSTFSGPVFIEQIAFSVSLTGLYLADVTIELGTTSVGVFAISTPLTNNITSPLTTVFTDPAFSQPVAAGAELFSLVFTLSVPFLYDPSLGENLLMQISVLSSSASLAASRGAGGGGATSSLGVEPTGIAPFVTSAALRTQITFSSAVPGPPVLPLLGFAFAGLGVIRWRRETWRPSRARPA